MKATEFKPTEEMITAADNVCKAKAKVFMIEPIVRNYQRLILKRHQFKVDGKVMLDPGLTYTLDETDAKVYYEESNKAREKAGLEVDDPEFCPLLVAENNLSEAKQDLIRSMKPITGGLDVSDFLCQEDGWEKYNKAVDLSLRLLVPFIKVKV
jgi:hypothetical protein